MTPTCHFTKGDGSRCGAVAVTESDFCYHHQEHYRRRRKLHNTFLGKSKVLEPFMSGAAAGRDPVTKRVYDALFADAVDALDLPPFDPPGDPVAVALTSILHLIATQQVERSITQQMLYTVRLAIANRDRLAAHAAKAAVGSRPSALGQKEEQSAAVGSRSSAVGQNEEQQPNLTADHTDHADHAVAEDRRPMTDDRYDPDDEDRPGPFDHLTPEEVSELYEECEKNGTNPLVALERINARHAAKAQQTELSDEFSPPTSNAPKAPCDSVVQDSADNRGPTTDNAAHPHRGGYVHKNDAWYEKKAREAEEYQRRDHATYIAKALKAQNTRDEREHRKRQQRAIMKGEYGETGTGD